MIKPSSEWRASERLQACLSHTGFALSELRRTESSYELSHDLSLIWLKYLGPKERALMLAAAIKSCDPRDAVFLRDFLNDILDETDVPPLEVR